MPTQTDAILEVVPPVRHELTVPEVVAHAEKIKQVIAQAMDDGIHYGRIPGTPKPTLLKAGAEKLCLLFRLDPEYESTETRDGDHLTVKTRCTLYHIPTGQRFGSGEGSCSTRESKYAYRKRGGDRTANLDLPDQYNTVLKMANKRALVAAVLNVTAASDVFTQDLEDLEEKPEKPKVPEKRADPVNRAGGEPEPPAKIPVPEWVKSFEAIQTEAAGRALFTAFYTEKDQYTLDEQTVVVDAKEAMKQRLGIG